VITTLAVENSFGQRKPMHTVIDSIHWLGVLVIQGAIIGAMGV
jgi:1,4-alpha-glucan branching enzyme